MNRHFLQRAHTVALALLLLAGAASHGPSLAAEKSRWNPMRWIPGTSQPVTDPAAEAKKLADEAMLEAERAEAAARQARIRAEKARTAAEEALSRNTPASQGQDPYYVRRADKPVVQTPLAEDAPALRAVKTLQNAADKPSGDTQPSERSSGQAGGGGWNPMNLFKAADDEDVRREQAEARAAQKARQQAEEAVREETLRRHEAQAEKLQREAQAEKLQHEAQAEKFQHETQAEKFQHEAQAEKLQREAHRHSEEDGGKNAWNMLGLFRKPETSEPREAAAEQPGALDQREEAVSPDQVMENKAVVVETEKGNIAIELYPQEAPLTVANFVKLVKDGFYNKYNMKFHRVIPGFVIQTGDPTGTGAGGSKERVPLEAKNRLTHNGKGVVAMARGADPHSASSQFYITLAPQTSLDGKYAIFGKVISGLDVLDKIEKDDMLYGVSFVDRSALKLDPQPERKSMFSKLF